MKSLAIIVTVIALALSMPLEAAEPLPPTRTSDLDIKDASVELIEHLGVVVFEMQVEGIAGGTLPEPAGQLDGAPVLGYVFPTSLRPEQVGFGSGDGIVALAATSHPDFDDTPLFDENGHGAYDDTGDGRVLHTHWVVLVPDERVAGGLSVKAVVGTVDGDLPPTSPGMPIYLDSPGYTVVTARNRLRIVVPKWRIRDLDAFRFDAVTAYMQVNTSASDRPMLGVYEVYSVLSGDLSLPKRFSVSR